MINNEVRDKIKDEQKNYLEKLDQLNLEFERESNFADSLTVVDLEEKENV